MSYKIFSIGVVVIGLLMTSLVSAKTDNREANKKVVAAFYNLAFSKHDPENAMKKYVGPKYIQHNPMAGDGKEPFIGFFKGYYKEHPQAATSVKRLIAERDLVVVHAHSKQTPSDLGTAAMDIFRLENGKIVEHWDVIQQVPEKAANQNTMF